MHESKLFSFTCGITSMLFPILNDCGRLTSVRDASLSPVSCALCNARFTLAVKIHLHCDLACLSFSRYILYKNVVI